MVGSLRRVWPVGLFGFVTYLIGAINIRAMNTDDRLSVPANATSEELRAWVETLQADELRIVLERLRLSLSGIVPVLRTRLMTAVDPVYAAERQVHERVPRRDDDLDTGHEE